MFQVAASTLIRLQVVGVTMQAESKRYRLDVSSRHSNITVRNISHRLVEHVSEADTLVRFSCVPTVHSLVN